MPRAWKFIWRPLLVLFVALCAREAFAQAAWPQYPLTGNEIERGPGFYISLPKLLASWFIFAAWVRTTDWISRDCKKLKLDYVKWNSTAFFTFAAAFPLHFLIPWYWAGVILLLAAYVGPLGAFCKLHNSLVADDEKVLTKRHLKKLVTQPFKKKDDGKEAVEFEYQKGPPIEFKPQGAENDRDNAARLINARQSPGFVPMKELLDDALKLRAHTFMLDYTREAVAARYQIDGVWHNREPRDRESGDMILAALKTLAGLDPAERRKKQEGQFQAEADGRKYRCELVSQGTKTGERALFSMIDIKHRHTSLLEMGMREKPREQLLEILGRDSGFVLLCAMPQGGLTSLIDATLEESDRLMRNYVAVEDKHHLEKDIENIEVTTYDSAAGETPDTALPGMIRKYPDVIVSRDLPNAETVEILCDQVLNEERLTFGGVRAKEAPEALLRVMMLKADPKKFAKAITVVVNQRMARKLCPSCKIGYEPTPDVLKKLGVPPGRVTQLFREKRPEDLQEKEEPCADCGGIGFQGRTGIFEMLVVDDKVREVLVKQPKLELVKKAARLAGMRSLQEEGIVLVAKGETSIPELMRVLKG
jgi:type II secretory ATPase GspE/PulE/Tfp pilus assembly ATPase PilB-like protein